MSTSFYDILKPFIWPRYYEEGPPRYINNVYFNRDLMDSDGSIKEPARSVLNLIILGYRPVTSLSILIALVENQNKPMYGSQIGARLEKKFQLPKGWFTKTRYYDTRVGKLLKILERQNILKEAKVKDWKTNKEYIGYQIVKDVYPTVKERVLSLYRGEGLSILTPSKTSDAFEEKTEIIKHCRSCNSITTSPTAKYCELCGKPLRIECPDCGKEMRIEYTFCLNCGKHFE